jgi:hypothetical protein
LSRDYALGDILWNAGNAFSCAWQVLRYLGGFCWAMLQPKAVLAARILALQSQLAVCKHRIDAGKAPQPRFNQAFRILWVILSKLLDRWEDLAQVMKPATVKKWHTAALRVAHTQVEGADQEALAVAVVIRPDRLLLAGQLLFETADAPPDLLLLVGHGGEV